MTMKKERIFLIFFTYLQFELNFGSSILKFDLSLFFFTFFFLY